MAKKKNTVATASTLDLVSLRRGKAVCTSLEVAEHFHKRHDHILRDIEKKYGEFIKNNHPKIGGVKNSTGSKLGALKLFQSATYVDSKGEVRPMYYMNRDGFALLVMGFTGKEALEWKLKYIQAFNAMEKFIMERHSEEWIEERKIGKLSRKIESSAINQLVESVQGTWQEKYTYLAYFLFSRLANSAVGIECGMRDKISARKLSNLRVVEDTITRVIQNGIENGDDMNTIYEKARDRVRAISDLAFMKEV